MRLVLWCGVRFSQGFHPHRAHRWYDRKTGETVHCYGTIGG